MYKIKNTELDLESRIFHLHKIFYSAYVLGIIPLFSFYLIPVKFTLTPSNVPFKKFPANHTFSKYEMSLGP